MSLPEIRDMSFGLLHGVEGFLTNLSSVHSDVPAPATASMAGNSLYSRFTVGPDLYVSTVVGAGYVSEVAPSIVGLISVYVVNVSGRKRPSHKHEGQSVSVLKSTENSKDYVPSIVRTASNGSGSDSSPAVFPSEHTSVGAVAENIYDVGHDYSRISGTCKVYHKEAA